MQLLSLLQSAIHLELKWHIAQLFQRLPGSKRITRGLVDFVILAKNPNESKIVRSFASRIVWDTANTRHLNEPVSIIDTVDHELIPSPESENQKLRSY